MDRRHVALGLPLAAAAATLHLPARAAWRSASDAERALDEAAFRGLDATITEQFGDVDSVVAVLEGRVAYQYHRDGAPERLRAVHSVAKSALSVLVGIALTQGRLAGLDQPVVQAVPAWAALNRDPRAAQVTLRHLLTMTAGFGVDDPTGTAPAGTAAAAWARPFRSAPGTAFAYDNAAIPLLIALLEQATGMPLADFARQQLVQPLGMQEPAYRSGLHLRTVDMARLGQLMLDGGTWNGQRLLDAAYAGDATRVHNAGGPPMSLPYGYLWWVVPSQGPRPTFFAIGYGGQFIWVHPPTGLVVATTSRADEASARRGQALRLIRERVFGAAVRRVGVERR